jgi:hypothetical protein
MCSRYVWRSLGSRSSKIAKPGSEETLKSLVKVCGSFPGGSNDLISQAKGSTCLHSTNNQRPLSLKKREARDVLLRISRPLIAPPSL